MWRTWRRLSRSPSSIRRRRARSTTSAAARNRSDIEPEITGKARIGDIRHCIADIGKIQRELGFKPRRDFSEGLAELAEWVAQQEAEDRVQEARKELEMRGLVA